MRESPRGPAYKFDRDHNLHETRDIVGLNRLRPAAWLRRNDRAVQLRTVEILEPLTRATRNPTVLVVGVGGGGIYEWLWREPGTLRLGIDVRSGLTLPKRRASRVVARCWWRVNRRAGPPAERCSTF